jgi:hypothetical protein
VQDGEATSSNSLYRIRDTNQSLVRLKKAAIKIEEAEIYHHSSELVMEIQRNALSLLEMLDIDTSVCNIEENVGEVHHSVNTERDQIKSAT